MQYFRMGPKARRAAYGHTPARLHLAHQVGSLFIGQADSREIGFFVESAELRRGNPDNANADRRSSGPPHFQAAPIGCVGPSPDSAPFRTLSRLPEF